MESSLNYYNVVHSHGMGWELIAGIIEAFVFVQNFLENLKGIEQRLRTKSGLCLFTFCQSVEYSDNLLSKLSNFNL